MSKDYYLQLPENSGCTDSNCKINKKSGQHTNGGCTCLRDLSTPNRIAIEKILINYSALIEENAKLKNSCMDMMTQINQLNGEYE